MKFPHIILFVVSLLFCFEADAKKEKRNSPSLDEVEESLKAAGDSHYPASMKIKKIGHVEAGDAYYHVFNLIPKHSSDDYAEGRTIIFNNSLQYMGYYEYPARKCFDYKIQTWRGADIPVSKEGPWDKWLREEGGYYENPITGDSTDSPRKTVVYEFIRASGYPNKPTEKDMRTWTYDRDSSTFRAAFAFQTERYRVYMRAENEAGIREYWIKGLSREDLKYIKEQK